MQWHIRRFGGGRKGRDYTHYQDVGCKLALGQQKQAHMRHNHGSQSVILRCGWVGRNSKPRCPSKGGVCRALDQASELRLAARHVWAIIWCTRALRRTWTRLLAKPGQAALGCLPHDKARQSLRSRICLSCACSSSSWGPPPASTSKESAGVGLRSKGHPRGVAASKKSAGMGVSLRARSRGR